MSTPRVIGIGNAMVDVISECDDAFLHRMGIQKGIMQLVDQDRALRLYDAMSNRLQAPGGSVANTIAGLGRLGVETSFIGKVANDDLGRFYAAALGASGTGFPNPPEPEVDLPTSRSMIFVTPDGERSMNTYLGAGADLNEGDVPWIAFADGGILFLEGYLFDKDDGKTAFAEAARAMHQAKGRAGITLSDPFCATRHRADFQRLVAKDMDFVIGNRNEWLALYDTDDLEAALARAAEMCRTIVCTQSGDPVIVLQDGGRAEAPVDAVTPVDATGAGDQFAAGFLYGYAKGRDPETCARMGVAAAAEVIEHVGPRPQRDVMAIFREAGLV